MGKLEEIADDGNVRGMQTDFLSETSAPKNSFYERTKNAAANYFVDTSAAWAFYTSLYGGIEYLSGMENEEILKARLMSLGVHAIIGRPVGKLRNKLADKWKITKESPWYAQTAVNVCSVLPIQSVLYTGMLVAAGASSEEIAVALPAGLGLGALLAEPFGRWMDIYRNFWGKRKAIK